MLEAIARKQREKVLTLYYDLIELRESPFGILALLIRQCNQLLQVKNLDRLGKNNGMIAKQMKVPVFVAGKLKDQAKLFSMEHCAICSSYVRRQMRRLKQERSATGLEWNCY